MTKPHLFKTPVGWVCIDGPPLRYGPEGGHKVCWVPSPSGLGDYMEEAQVNYEKDIKRRAEFKAEQRKQREHWRMQLRGQTVVDERPRLPKPPWWRPV
jgi:hypothetical protein